MDLWFPVFDSFFTSTISEEDEGTRLVFLGLMSMANKGRRDGKVKATIEAISRYVNLKPLGKFTPLERTRRAMEVLQSPDPNSTTEAEDGRRVIAEGRNVWRIVNYEFYAAKLRSDFRRAQSAAYMKEKRRAEKLANVSNVSVKKRLDKNREELKEGAKPPLPQAELAALALAIKTIRGEKRKPTKAEIQVWKRLRKQYSIHDIINCIRWAVHDDFWGTNVKGFAPLGRAKVSGDAIKFEKVWEAYQRSPAVAEEQHARAVEEHVEQRKRKPVISEEQRQRNIEAMRQKMKEKPIR